MRKAAIAGALALATMGMSSALADDVQGRGEWTRPTTQAGFVLTESHIARLRSVLNLNAAQERYWPAVEAALRNIMRQQASWAERGSRGFLQFAGAYSYQAAGFNRLMSAALPLIKTLDEGQKREAMSLARAIGIQAIPVSF
jgi:zinc resistance-associated protein